MTEETKEKIEAVLRDGSPAATAEQVISALDKLGISNSTVSHAPMRTVEDSIALREGMTGGFSKNLFLRNKKAS